MLVSWLGLGGVFLGCSVSLGAGAVFTLACVPATKDKPMAELETLFLARQRIGLDTERKLGQMNIACTVREEKIN